MVKLVFLYDKEDVFWKSFKENLYGVRCFTYNDSIAQFLKITTDTAEIHTLKIHSPSKTIQKIRELEKDFRLSGKIKVLESCKMEFGK